jgi:aspartate/methionine/tyrosine aminotransferase
MNFKHANRLNDVAEYYFSQKLGEIAKLNGQGKNIINLGIGSPDLPPHPTVIDALNQSALKNNAHSYQSYKGIPRFRESVARWYRKYYSVTLEPDSEILPLMGSKEGLLHLCMSFLNEGDLALVPDPGYPTYQAAVRLAGAKCINYRLKEENNWFPDFNELEKQVPPGVKMMFVNYPNMPTGANATTELFEKMISFGKKHRILIINDNPYSFILNNEPMSILQTPGALETAVELNSLSKCLNMAGWRIGMLCGNRSVLQEVLRFKSNMDSGMFLPVQEAAVIAMELDQHWYEQLNSIYRKRKEPVLKMMDFLSATYLPGQQGLFVWAKTNSKFKDGYALSDWALYEKNVFITPGGIFGESGKPYIRISLCQPEPVLQEALLRIQS